MTKVENVFRAFIDGMEFSLAAGLSSVLVADATPGERTAASDNDVSGHGAEVLDGDFVMTIRGRRGRCILGAPVGISKRHKSRELRSARAESSSEGLNLT